MWVEENGKRILIDPGGFTWESGQLTDEVLSHLDYCLVTHEHFDHFNEEAFKKIKANSPSVKFKAGPAVVKKLQAIGIVADSDNDQLITLDVGEHAHLWEGIPIFENTKMTIAGKLMHVGDSMDIAKAPPILCLPIFGPWLGGTITDAANIISKLKPKYIIPIHDWHYNDQARTDLIKWLEGTFKEQGTEFIATELGREFDLNV